ncbi:hypothetical protein BJ508DRAFT_310256 [Ascobolus immersus RN42]|uniref:Ubiquitin 3 binding protein But2 C-terminal domain-containing protein n=1 Tax=Ascobolus immersus RN42 TaxID=1160509 RepID=A0A3N4HTW8_ASCIM|nr:hypothetical protein BJ508DRAFT_310256 [Ascobolus immersus RN42]
MMVLAIAFSFQFFLSSFVAFALTVHPHQPRQLAIDPTTISIVDRAFSCGYGIAFRNSSVYLHPNASTLTITMWTTNVTLPPAGAPYWPVNRSIERYCFLGFELAYPDNLRYTIIGQSFKAHVQVSSPSGKTSARYVSRMSAQSCGSQAGCMGVGNENTGVWTQIGPDPFDEEIGLKFVGEFAEVKCSQKDHIYLFTSWQAVSDKQADPGEYVSFSGYEGDGFVMDLDLRWDEC